MDIDETKMKKELALLAGANYKEYLQSIRNTQNLMQTFLYFLDTNNQNLPIAICRAMKAKIFTPAEEKTLISKMIEKQDVECISLYRSYFFTNDNEKFKRFADYVLNSYVNNPEKLSNEKYAQLVINFNLQNIMVDILPILEDERKKKLVPQTVQQFHQSHKFENVPTWDSIAEYYVDNHEYIKDKNEDQIYNMLSDCRNSNVSSGKFYDSNKIQNNCYSSSIDIVVKHIDAHTNADVAKFGKGIDAHTDGRAPCFVYFYAPTQWDYLHTPTKENQSSPAYSGKEYANPIKLWLNVTQTNLPYVTEIIRSYYVLHPEFAEEFKIDIEHDRNDVVTIYTYESYATDFINYIQKVDAKLKSFGTKYPPIFEQDAYDENKTFDNPFTIKIGNIFSLAEIGHDQSYPRYIAKMFAQFNNEIDADNLSEDEFVRQVKLNIIKQMRNGTQLPVLEKDAPEQMKKVFGNQKLTTSLPLKNPYNMATSYTKGGHSFENLSPASMAELNKLYDKMEASLTSSLTSIQ